MYPKSFDDLIQAFRRLPGVGAKTAERYAFTALDWDEETLETFVTALQRIKTDIHRCKVCGNLCEGEVCSLCKDDTRDKSTICVVQNPKDIAAIESMQEYKGLYHVLNGTINTQKGILPEDLNIPSLLDRINDNIEEVILATDPTMEGETTALYLEKLLQDKVKVTRLAYGIPVGGHLDYTDTLTLLKAFQGRK